MVNIRGGFKTLNASHFLFRWKIRIWEFEKLTSTNFAVNEI
jgi:hypothetical protein